MNSQPNHSTCSYPRDVDSIFNDIRALTQRDGALHHISSIFYRDWFVAIDMQEGRVVDKYEKRWSAEKLNNNEIMLLLGLMVQSPSDRIYTIAVSDNNFENVVDRLFREFHDRLTLDARPDLRDPTTVEKKLGSIAREAIYYGADSFFLHQFERFSRDRYRNDFEWLIRNVNFSARPMVQIAQFVMKQVARQTSQINSLKDEGVIINNGDMTSSLMVAKSHLIKKFGASKTNAFIERFSTPATNANRLFTSPFVINHVNLSPTIDIGEHIYAPNAYRLFESIYESPTYWMMSDHTYRDTASKHRGAFLERTTAKLFRSVFGNANVYENVTIHLSKSRIAGEADALVVYGEFVIIVQAKSKRVTLKARSGDEKALASDFENAIQHPYQQAYKFAELIENRAECRTKDGKILVFSPTVRIFPAVVLSDPFPSVTFLSSMMLERSERIAPVIWDLGVLDCVTRMLPSPIEFLYYLKCRSDVFEKIGAMSEYIFLGYHIKYKLTMAADVDFMILDNEFEEIVEDYMMPHDVGLAPIRPIGVLEKIDLPIIADLFKFLKEAPPDLASIVVDLYDFSHDSLVSFAKLVEKLRVEVTAGKEMKAFSIRTASGGITYLVCRTMNKKIRTAAEAIGNKHKYDSKRDRWYVIVDNINSRSPVDGLLPLTEKWHDDAALAENSRKVKDLFGSRFQPRNLLP